MKKREHPHCASETAAQRLVCRKTLISALMHCQHGALPDRERLYASRYIADTGRHNLLNCISVKRLRRQKERDRARRHTQTAEQAEARLQHDRERCRKTRSIETLEQ